MIEYVQSRHTGRIHVADQSRKRLTLCGRRIGIGERGADKYDVACSDVCGKCHIQAIASAMVAGYDVGRALEYKPI